MVKKFCKTISVDPRIILITKIFMNKRGQIYRELNIPMFKLSFILLIIIGAVSCFNNVENPGAINNKPNEAFKYIPKIDGKVKFKQTGGLNSFSLKFYEDGLKLSDESDNEIARITRTSDGKYKIKDAEDIALGYVTGASPKFKLTDQSQQLTQFIFQKQNDGDWKLETVDGGEIILWKVGKREYGWKIECSSNSKLSKIKEKDGRIAITDGDDKTIVYTNDEFSPLATVPFTFSQLTKAQQAGLSAALNMEGIDE